MRPPRAPRVQRKLIYTLAAGITIIFVYNQFLSYAILTDDPDARARTHAECDHPYAEPIDVVYTWVNGTEERFQREVRLHAGAARARPDAYAAQRFADKQELRYSLRSVERHMRWARHVYIVTNGQIPSWLNLDHPRVSVVMHEEIFPEGVLPTFSSPAIEANLHRIPGLSDKFVYFNDDVFLNADVYPEDFYTRNRGYKIYTAWGADCARNCEWQHIGNGRCDAACHTEDCDYDGGDCGPLTSIPSGAPANSTRASAADVSRASNAQAPPFLAYEANRTDGVLLAARIRRYNADKMRDLKLMRVLRRERNSYHVADVRSSSPQPAEHLEGHAPNVAPSLVRKDLYSAALIYTQKLLGRMFGFRRRNVIAHAPLMIDRRIMAEVQAVFPAEFATTVRSRFRRVDNLQVAFVYSYYLALSTVERSMAEVFDEYDTDQSGTWSDREIHTLLTRVYRLPLQIEMVADFQRLLNNCTNSLSAEALEAEFRRSIPKYERYVDSQLSVVTKRMIVECTALRDMLQPHDAIARRGKYRHEFVEAAEHVSFNQLHSVAPAAMDTLNSIRRTPRKFVCINDDLDRTNATRADNELLLTLLEDFFVSLFPTPSHFELPPAYRNRFARMDELRAWQRRWRQPAPYIPYLAVGILAIVAVLLLHTQCIANKRRS